MPNAQELLRLAGKQAEPMEDPERQRPEMKPHDMLQAELAARMPRPDAMERLLQSITATTQVASCFGLGLEMLKSASRSGPGQSPGLGERQLIRGQ